VSSRLCPPRPTSCCAHYPAPPPRTPASSTSRCGRASPASDCSTLLLPPRVGVLAHERARAEIVVGSLRSAPARALIFCIELYRTYVSPTRMPTCRFTPTCSEYAVEALRTRGV